MPTRLIAGNWKMHKTVREAHDLAAALRALLDGSDGADVVVCPPFTALAEVGKTLAGSRIELGAQDVHWEAKGAYTGEVSAPMLWDLGCLYTIVGHSERRRLLSEGDETIRRKVNAALANELVPILCVGESKEERDAGRTERIVQTQARIATMDVAAEAAGQLVIAYEPVWAIGSGTPATGAEANRIAQMLRGSLTEWFGSAAASIRILYGGSVTPDTIGEFASQSDIDGALVGGASLDADTFAAIVKAFNG
jgi:triosephosphate isomerase